MGRLIYGRPDKQTRQKAKQMQTRLSVPPILLERRSVLKATAGLGALLIGIVPAAAAKQSSVTVGGLKITTFSDGHLALPEQMFAPRVDAKKRAAALKLDSNSSSTVRSPLNVTLIETGKDKILVDVGSGPHFMDTAGKLADSLEAGGVDPESITKVIYTHAHPDHIWGTVNDFDELSFPNATYYISEAEWNFWMSKEVFANLPKERQAFAVGAQRTLKVIKDHLVTIKPGKELLPGINVVDTSGHTPGHVSLEIGSGKDVAFILGDALTHPVISFRYPDWRPAVDQEPDRAVRTRRRLLGKLSHEGHKIIGYHLPQPGLGRVAASGSTFQFEPLS